MTGLFRFLARLPERYGRISSGRTTASIDGLRFIALAVVMVGHLSARLYQFPNAATLTAPALWSALVSTLNQTSGVLLFFVISGYVTAMQLARPGQHIAGPAGYAKYLLSRSIRIVPPYYVVIIGTYLLLLATNFQPDNASFQKQAVSNESALVASLLYSYGWYYDSWPKLFVAGWSLEIEIQFYLLAPFVILALHRIRDERRRMLVGIAGVVATLALIATDVGTTPNLRFTLVRFATYFLAGIVLFDAHRWIQAAGGFRIPPLAKDAVAFLALLAYLAFHQPYESDWASWISSGFLLANLIAIIVMIMMALEPDTLFCGLLSNKYVAFIGAACYSIYLTHMQVIFVATKLLYPLASVLDHNVFTLACYVLVIPVILVVGVVFYIVVERPFMSKKISERLFSRSRSEALVGRR